MFAINGRHPQNKHGVHRVYRHESDALLFKAHAEMHGFKMRKPYPISTPEEDLIVEVREKWEGE